MRGLTFVWHFSKFIDIFDSLKEADERQRMSHAVVSPISTFRVISRLY